MKWVRKDIDNLKEYKVDNKEYRIKLDANEGENILLKDFTRMDMEFLKDINRYPGKLEEKLKEEIGGYIKVKTENIILGNGSSEMIDLVMKTFIDKGDRILSFIPTFSMYSIFSNIYGGEFVGIQGESFYSDKSPREDFSLDIDILIEKAKEINPKLIILCNPNNPTGFLIDKASIKKLLENVDSIVLVDEAYIEFAEESMVDEIDIFDNLVVLRTFSKALGLAGLRLGYLLANLRITNIVNKVKPPYNLNSLSQGFAIRALENKVLIKTYVESVKVEREILYGNLKELGLKVYPSSGNFILFYSQVKGLGEKLESKGILIRVFSGELESYYRVTIGNKYENREFVNCLEEVLKNEKSPSR